MKYPKVPKEIVRPSIRSEKEKFYREMGFSGERAEKFKYQTWEKFYAQKARMEGFKNFMDKRNMSYKDAIREIASRLDDVYTLSEFFEEFRAWYQATFGYRA